MNNLEGLHPGLVLKTMFLEPLKLSVYRLAKDIHVPQTRLSQIIAGERSITPDTALRLSKYFGLEEIFWLELQAVYGRDSTVPTEKPLIAIGEEHADRKTPSSPLDHSA